MFDYADAIKLCNLLNRSRSEQHEIRPDTLVRNLNYTFTGLIFEFDDLYGYKVVHHHDPQGDETSDG